MKIKIINCFYKISVGTARAPTRCYDRLLVTNFNNNQPRSFAEGKAMKNGKGIPVQRKGIEIIAENT